jgi:Lrp/AsnC family leucine-responsive transcriptional regulator
MLELDAFDHRILAILAQDARRSHVEMQAEVRLSHSAISRRIARLEKAGVIQGYRAVIDHARLGLTVRAFVAVSREASVPTPLLAEALGRIPGVVTSYVVTGDQDIFLDIRASDLQAFADLMLKHVQATRGVTTTRTIFVMQEWQGQSGLPAAAPNSGTIDR